MDRQETREETKPLTGKDVIAAHYKALDELVNVNSLFTVTVFLGLSLANRGQKGLETRDECQAGPDVGKRLIVYEVVAFACFLFSNVVAKVIKLHLYLHDNPYLKCLGRPYRCIGEAFDFKDAMLVLTVSASVTGMVMVTMSVVQVIQLRIGLISCGSPETKHAVWALCLIVGVALVIYIVSVAIAIYASMKSDTVHGEQQHGKTDDDTVNRHTPLPV